MSTTERSEEPNKLLIDKILAGSSPTSKNRRDRFSNGSNKPSEDAKFSIQKDILESLKESDGLPALIYPQDYIFDIAHLRTNGNLGELIDDMSNISNPEEKFEMVKSENKILRERLHNALQREMKAIKTFQKLARDNRLMLLKLKEYETNARLSNSDMNENECPSPINGNDRQSVVRTGNDEHRRHDRLTIDNIQTNMTVHRSTSTNDLEINCKDQSTSTEDLCIDDPKFEENVSTDEPVDNSKKSKKRPLRELFKTKSSPNIMKAAFDDEHTLEIRGRSSSLGSYDREQNQGLPRIIKSASSGAIDSSANGTPIDKKPSDKRRISFPSILDVVDEESDVKDNNSTVSRSSLSSEITQSYSSDVESISPCQTPTLQRKFSNSESLLTPPPVSLQIIHFHSKSLPSAMNQTRSPFYSSSKQNDDVSMPKPKNQTSGQKNPAEFPKSKFFQLNMSKRLTRGESESSKTDGKLKTNEDSKESRSASSSEDSDMEARAVSLPSALAAKQRRRFVENSPNGFADDIRKFQEMFNSGQIAKPSHESDDEEDILHAYEAARSARHSCRRGSSVVQLPASSVQMDLHVATEDGLENSEGHKRQAASHLALEDIKRSSRWSSILKNKKKMKDKVRMSEDLKEYLSTMNRPTHIASETELSLYKDTHWTHLMSVTDETGKARKLSQVDTACLPESEMKRREAVWELFHSEVVYLTAHLLVLKECFLEPLRDIQNKGFLVSVDDKKIFSNLEDLCEVSAKFAKALLHLFKNEQKDQFGSTASVVTAFTKFKCTVHPQYERYCLSYTKTLHYLESLKKKKHVQEFFEWCERDTRCNRLKLRDMLVAPFQHLTKYPLLLKNIRKRTSEADSQHAPLTTTIKSVENLIQELEGNVTVVRNYQKLKDLQKNLVWPSVGELDPKSFIPEHLKNVVSHQECGDILASPKRELIYEGTLTLYESAKTEITAFLFDDMLLLTKGTKKNSNRLKKMSTSSMPESLGLQSPTLSRRASDYTYIVWKQPLPIDRFILHDLDKYPGNSIKNGFVLVHISRFKQAIAIHTLQASSPHLKSTWLSKLKDAQTKWNEVLEQEEKNETDPPDKRKRNSQDLEYHNVDTDSEQEGAETNSDNDEQVSDAEDMEVQQTLEDNLDMKPNNEQSEIDNKTTHNEINRNNEPNNNEVEQSRFKMSRRKISRLTSAM